VPAISARKGQVQAINMSEPATETNGVQSDAAQPIEVNKEEDGFRVSY